MARFVMFASLGSVILFLLTLVVPPSAQAQANALATPIPGSGHDYIHMAGWPSLWVPSRLKAAPPFVVFKGWVPRTLRAKPVHSRTNFEVPTLAKNARVGQPQLWWSQEHSNAGWASPPRSSEYVSGWWPLAAFLQRCGFCIANTSPVKHHHPLPTHLTSAHPCSTISTRQ